METITAKKAKKLLEANYPLEWEERALQEVISNFKTAWRTKPDLFKELSEENGRIDLGPWRLHLISNKKELNDLYEKILSHLIFQEPYLCRMLAYITIEPKDREAGRSFFNQYIISPGRIMTYYELLDCDVLTGSLLAKRYKLSGVPLDTCLSGQVLLYLINEAEARRNTDFEIQQYIKLIWEKKGPVFDYSTKDAYDSPLTSQIIDDVLYDAVNNAHKDRRQAVFFGRDFNPDHKVIMRYRSEEQEIPFQLLPKYAGLIRKRTKGLPKVETTVTGDNGKVRTKQEHDLTAVEMLFLEAVLDQEPCRIKPPKMPFVAFIENQLTWRLGEEWDNQSTESRAKERSYNLRKQYAQSDEKDVQAWFEKEKRINKPKMEQSGGSLDDPLDNDDEGAGRRVDITEDTETLDPESSLLERERDTLKPKFRQHLLTDKRLARFIQIHFKEDSKRRSIADQKFHERYLKEEWPDKKKKLQEKLNIPT